MAEENENNDGGQSATLAEPAASAEPTVAALPESFKETPSLADFKDVETLGQAYVNLKQYQGASLRIPGEDAGDEARQEFRSKVAELDGVMLRPDFDNPEQSKEFFKSLGTPEDSSGYEYTPVDDFQVDDARIGMFKELASQNNLTKSQFSNIMENIIKSDAAQLAASQEEKQADTNALKTEWGEAYNQNMNQALSVAKATGAPEKVQAAMQSGETGSAFNKWMHSLASKFNGEGNNLMEEHQEQTHKSPGEIKAQIDEIMNNKEHPYWDGGHPEHDAAVQKMLDLNRKIAA